MSLMLQITSAQRQTMGASASHTFGPAGGTIGRKTNNDWVLQGDPYISSTHAAVSAQGSDYYLTDVSSNGTGFNARDRMLPKEQPIKLNDGDVLFIGEYEINVCLSAQASNPLDMFEPVGARPDPFAPVMPADPFSAESHPDPFNTGPHTGGTMPAPQQVADMVSSDQTVDPLELLGGPADPAAAPSQPGAIPNHTPAEADYFVPPPVVPGPAPAAPSNQQLPDDWDLTGFSGRDTDILPGNQSVDPFQTAEQLPPPAPAAVPQPPPAMPPSQHPPSAAPPAGVTPPPPVAAGAAVSADLAEVLRGAGLDPNLVSPELANEFGQILKVVVAGLIEVLKARTEIKSQFRVPVTTIKPVENNPLKFSAGVEDALYNLLVKKGTGYLGPVDAFEEGFEDIKAHQMAMLAGMRAAFNHMLQRFDPNELENVFGGKRKRSSLMAVGSKLKYWEQYRDHYREICDEAEDNFQRLFGEAFAQAYEEQMQRLTALARNKPR